MRVNAANVLDGLTTYMCLRVPWLYEHNSESGAAIIRLVVLSLIYPKKRGYALGAPSHTATLSRVYVYAVHYLGCERVGVR